MTKNRTRTPVYLDPGMHPGLEVKGLMISSLCRTDCFQRSFYNMIVQMWNSLLQSIRCISSYNTFVSELKQCFLEKVDSQFMSNDCCSWHFKCLCNNCRL